MTAIDELNYPKALADALARADAAEKERDRLRAKLAKCHGDLMVADQRLKELLAEPAAILPTPAPWEGAP